MKRNVKEVVGTFNKEMTEHHHRYRSFDFCYAHFRQTKENLGKNSPTQEQIKESCFVLWGYLASWGMLRGSSFLLQKNPAYLKELVEWIYEQPESTWEIDVEHYDAKADFILELYAQTKDKILKGKEHKDLTLVTKILLGVFAIVPAFDSFFTDTFSEIAGDECGFTTLNQTALTVIHKFYLDNKAEIDELAKEMIVRDFEGNQTKYHYSVAKIIDMYGFQASRPNYNED